MTFVILDLHSLLISYYSDDMVFASSSPRNWSMQQRTSLTRNHIHNNELLVTEMKAVEGLWVSLPCFSSAWLSWDGGLPSGIIYVKFGKTWGSETLSLCHDLALSNAALICMVAGDAHLSQSECTCVAVCSPPPHTWPVFPITLLQW